MGHALWLAADDPLFKTHPHLTVRKGQFSYSIETRNGQTTYRVTDGSDTISAPIHWAFGDQSQTYVLERDGQFYESVVSYFKALDGLDTTIGDQSIEPKTVQQAFGRPLGNSEKTLCFGCHSTGTVVNHNLHFESFHPGVSCQHCHAGADKHLQAIKHAKLNSIPPKLETFSPEQISNFCGQCHRTWQTVMRDKLLGQINIRFQPYRLEVSKCFDGSDRRLSCISCHDPHQQVVRDDKAYDAKCLACHSSGAKLSLGMIKAHPTATAMPVCPVSKANCVSCHMPKMQLAGAHQAFTDHDIRVVQAGQPYPD
jgi:Zn finger protein HypA/HybF involved in hydrogenase expression